MGDKTKIEWTDATWNPTIGCSRISEGCRNCYAERVAARFAGPGQPYEGVAELVVKERMIHRSFKDGSFEGRWLKESFPRWTGAVKVAHKHMLDPIRWNRPRRVFVNSMSDLFHERLSFEDIGTIFGIMASAPQHTFQCLTKRPARMVEFFKWIVEQDASTDPAATKGRCHALFCALQWENNHGAGTLLHNKWCADPSGPWPLPNVWLGVSVEDQATAEKRIPYLWDVPAAVRFLSMEPLLGPVDLTHLTMVAPQTPHGSGVYLDSLHGRVIGPDDEIGRRIGWVICGGESGPGARPMEEQWARSLRDQCKVADVPFFFKQGSQKNWPKFKEFSSFPESLQVRDFPQVSP